MRDDPDVVALTLNEAWTCATPSAIRSLLGGSWTVVPWPNTAPERGGVAILVKYGTAGAAEDRVFTKCSSGAEERRVLRVPIYVDAAKTQVVQLYATHLTGCQAEVNELRAFMGERAGEPQLLLGDFNIRSDQDYAMFGAWAGSGLVDVWPLFHTSEGETATWNTSFGSPTGNLYKRIDYAWTRNLTPTAIARFNHNGTPGVCKESDHAGLVVTFDQVVLGWPNPNGDGTNAIVRLLGDVGNGSAADLLGGAANTKQGDYRRSATAPSNVYLDTNPGTNHEWCWMGDRSEGLPFGFERPGDPEGNWAYARAEDLPGGTADNATTKYLRFRTALANRVGDILIPDTATNVAIEYKDNLFDPSDPVVAPVNTRPASENGVLVEICHPNNANSTSRSGNVFLGVLGGKRDHKWKRAVFAIPSTAPKSGGQIRIRLNNRTLYGNAWFYGSMRLHRILVTTGGHTIPPRPEVAGFWPAVKTFFGQSYELRNDLLVRGAVAGPGEKVRRNNRIFDRTGRRWVPLMTNIPQSLSNRTQIDAIKFSRPNLNIGMGYAQGNYRRNWSREGLTTSTQRSISMGEMISICRGLCMFSGPWCYTDPNADYTPHLGPGEPLGEFGGVLDGVDIGKLYDGTWRGVIRVNEHVSRVLGEGEPNVPIWMIKDEWDHEGLVLGQKGTGAATDEETSRDLRAAINRGAPTVMTVTVTMGWKRGNIQAGFDQCDIQLIDRYPNLFGLPLAEVAVFCEEARRVAQGRPFVWTISHANVATVTSTSAADPDDWTSPEVIRILSYMAFVHGAVGIWLFGDAAGMAQAGQAAIDYYTAVGVVLDEFKALADVIHGSAVELGRYRARTSTGANPLGENSALAEGTVTVSGSDRVALVDRLNPYQPFDATQARRVLLVINEDGSAGHTITITLGQVRSSLTATVLYEGNDSTPKSRQIAVANGSFQLTLAAHERKAILIPSYTGTV